jgi:hypothetical protein
LSKTLTDVPLVAAELVIPLRGQAQLSNQLILEGHLRKFSSGALTSRWQKRYFVLRENELVYYSKKSEAGQPEAASVRFDVSRIKGVQQAQAGREFEIIIGRGNSRVYQLRADTPEGAKQWMDAIEGVIDKFSETQDLGQGSADSIASSDDEDYADSSLNDGSSIRSSDFTTSVVLNSGTPADINSAVLPETLWEQDFVTSEDLDALFAMWFSFMDDPRAEIKAGRMIDGASRAISDLWAILGALPRGEDLGFYEAHDKIIKRYGMSVNQEHDKAQWNTLTGEYVMRLCKRFYMWGLRKPLNPDDLPVIIEWLSRLVNQLRSLPVGEHDLAQPLEQQEASPSPTHSERGSIVGHVSKWSKGLRLLIRKLAAEWEVSLIEQVNKSMQSPSVWDYAAVQETQGASVHGPCKSWVVPPFFLGVPEKPVIATSWTAHFISVLHDKCISRSTRATAWSVAYPTCVELLTVHSANAMVACLNACWRELKKRTTLYVSKHSSSRVGRVLDKMKDFTGRISVSNTSPTREGETTPPPAGQSAAPSTNMAQENLLAFGNEVVLISSFCQHASALVDFKRASPVFRDCLESLSQTFAPLVNEVSKGIVKVHFIKKNHKVIKGAFDPKYLAVRVKVPIAETLDAVKSFLDSLDSMGTHDLLRFLITGHLMQGVSNSYITSLIEHKPKMSKFTRLAAVVSEDEGLFFTLFKLLGRQPTEINTAIDQIGHVRAVLSEKNLTPPSKGGMALVHQCVELVKIFQWSQRGVDIAKALLQIKGISKTDRKDILYSVSACIERNVQSPSPQMLDLSREEDTEEAADHSGFSSNPSSSRHDDESF